jgi:hypothetical protein
MVHLQYSYGLPVYGVYPLDFTLVDLDPQNFCSGSDTDSMNTYRYRYFKTTTHPPTMPLYQTKSLLQVSHTKKKPGQQNLACNSKLFERKKTSNDDIKSRHFWKVG